MTSEREAIEIKARLLRAVERLEEKRDNTSRGNRLEVARLDGKIEGVKLAASYLEEGERIFRAVDS